MELLHAIFTDVYAHKPLEGRICRALLHLQDEFVRSKYREIKVVGSTQLLQYARTVGARYMLGGACQSLTITSDEKRPRDKLTDVDFESFLASLPHLRKFVCNNGQLCRAFLDVLKKPGVPPFPDVDKVDLSPPSSTSFAVDSLLKLSSLAELTLLKHCPTRDVPVEADVQEPIVLPRLASLCLDLLGGEMRSVV